MSSKYLLIISKDYCGSNTSESIAKNFSQQLANLINIPQSNITQLISNDLSLTKLKESIYTFVNKSLLDNSHDPQLYIYINGHGNQTMDANGDQIQQLNDNNDTNIDGQAELYQLTYDNLTYDNLTDDNLTYDNLTYDNLTYDNLTDDNLTDDELIDIIDRGILQSNSFSRPFVFIISDHCSYDYMIDKTQMYFDWISLGSSLDNHDYFIGGDGNTMTFCLMNVLEANKSILNDMTSLNLFILLNNEMKNSFIGDFQSPIVHISHPSMMNFKLFQ
jgi:hypothetical protein